MNKNPENHLEKKFPMYRTGTKEEVTSKDLTEHVAKVMSDIYSVRYGREITIRLGEAEEDTKK